MFHIELFFRTKATTSLDAQPPAALHLLPLPNTDDDPQSLLGQPILIHSQVLNDANTQRTTTFHSTSMHQATTTIDVLQQANANSSIVRAQMNRNQHMQTQCIRKAQKV